VTLANEWNPQRARVDAEAFEAGRMGPYRVGRSVRVTAAGEVVLAIHDGDPRVVELELLDPIKVVDPERPVLQHVNHMIGVEHRHVSTVLGAGLHDGIAYVSRVHHMGRTLAQVMVGGWGEPRLAPGIAYAVADALAYLADAGPHPGACALGGFDPRDVGLGFDGSINLVGVGLQTLRESETPAAADRSSLVQLSLELDRWLGTDISSALAAHGGPAEFARGLRKRYRDDCAHRRQHVGAFLRAAFADSVREERAFFGLSTLH
jgi:hypothetical protein